MPARLPPQVKIVAALRVGSAYLKIGTWVALVKSRSVFSSVVGFDFASFTWPLQPTSAGRYSL